MAKYLILYSYYPFTQEQCTDVRTSVKIDLDPKTAN